MRASVDSETGQTEIRAMKAEIHRMKVGGRREVWGAWELGVLGGNHSSTAACSPSTRKLAVPFADLLCQGLSNSCSNCTEMVTGHTAVCTVFMNYFTLALYKQCTPVFLNAGCDPPPPSPISRRICEMYPTVGPERLSLSNRIQGTHPPFPSEPCFLSTVIFSWISFPFEKAGN